MKTLGLIGGMSWESTAVYYRLLNEGTRRRRGELHSAKLLLWSFDFAEIAGEQAAGHWDALTGAMIDAGRRLQRAGAEGLVICTNTMHRMAEDIERSVPIPLIHIADATAHAIHAAESRRPALLATRFTMEQNFYVDRLRLRHGIDTVVPDSPMRDLIHGIIYEELCRGIVRAKSRNAYRAIIRKLQEKGADGVIFGCTEISLLLSQADVDVPVFDTTALHAAAALDFALADTPVAAPRATSTP